MSRLNRIGREIAAQTRLRRYLYHRYDYSFSPHQLGFLVDCLDRTSKVPGAVLEVGCAYGHTTVFLNKHLDTTGDQRRYVCIDTFRGFTSTDIAVEERDRGKTPASLAIIRRSYADASLRAFQRTMANNSVTRVTAVRADIESWKPDGAHRCVVLSH